MRYFWAEDFNDGKNGCSELEKKLCSYYDLDNDKVIIKKDLNSMIEFLEQKRNFREIDAFLLDIRFPVSDCDIKTKKKSIYDLYYKDFITSDMYNNNIDEAPGLLLYLLLIFRYHISLDKIVFLSAHITDEKSLLESINNIKEYLYKRKLFALSNSDKEHYTSLLNHVFGPFIKNNSYSVRDLEWVRLTNLDTDEILTKLDKFVSQNEEHFSPKNKNDNTLQQYKQLHKQFNDIGLSMPLAFGKPNQNIDLAKKYSFLCWKKEISSKPYTIIRSSIQEMIILLCEKMNECLYRDFKKLLTCNEYELDKYDNDYFKSYLEQISDILPLESNFDKINLNNIAVKEIASIWENASLPDYDDSNFSKRSGNLEYKKRKNYFTHSDPCFYAIHSTMKITRNWTGHQGIKDIQIIDVGFIFAICMRGIFDIDKLGDSQKEYLKYENSIFSLFEKSEDVKIDLDASFKYFCKLNNASLKTRYSDDIYERISGLGNAASKIRLEVSMDEIYMLFYHTICKGLKLDINNYPTEEYKLYMSNYITICKNITHRTWFEWNDRYNERFNILKLLNC